jgi:lytic cellulose monooxygenase (C1-hydroxylating)
LLIASLIDAWANEDLIRQDTADTFQLPSDIKPGLYILRTELLALHGNRMSSTPTVYSGPQFYTHCFNVEISGTGNAVPEGVNFPGGYKRDDPGVKFNLYTSEAAWDNYVSLISLACAVKLT